MADVIHSKQTTQDGIHIIIAIEYANEADRLAATPVSSDVGKAARQQDDGTCYLLTQDSPLVWEQLGGDYIHRLSFADEAARLAYVPTSFDVGKVAKQEDDNSFWLLRDDSPVTWQSLNGTLLADLGAGTLADLNQAITDCDLYPDHETVVAANGCGEFTTIQAALAAGRKNIYVRNGVYVETADLVVPAGGSIVGESVGQTIIVLPGAFKVVLDGSARLVTGGTISISSGSTTVTGVGTTFTSLNAGDYIKVGGVWNKIASITNALSLELENAYQGPTKSSVSYIAQSMQVAGQLENLIIANSTVEGLVLQNCFHVSIKNVLVTNCGATGVPAIRVSDCAEILFLAAIAENSVDCGLCVEDSDSLEIITCSFKNCGGDGVQIQNCKGVILDGCLSFENAGNGLKTGNGANKINITDSLFLQNSGDGVYTGVGALTCILDSCTSSENGGNGVRFDGDNNTVEGCIIDGNGQRGVFGGDNGSIVGNHVTNNGQDGIDLLNDAKCVVSGNIVHDNGGDGIDVGQDCCVTSNVVYNNGLGIRVSKNNSIISSNRVTGNTNEGIDITASANDTICSLNNCVGNTGTNIDDSGTGTLLVNNKS